MDWDSPTTKKHMAEAKAQGCQLLGLGKNCYYRIYVLPCGHEQELALANMRTGAFRCQICLNDKFKKEARERECELIGQGSKKDYRTYRLKCGHEREIRISEVRTGRFHCPICFERHLNAEAEAHGCVMLGPGKDANYRTFRLPCGHKQELKTAHLRVGRFRCAVCLEAKLIGEAEAQGCRLLGPGSNRHHRTYGLPCGHQQDITTIGMRRGIFRCQTCLEAKHHAEAQAEDCELLGQGRTTGYRIYRLPCGHEQEVTTAWMRAGSFRCQICLTEKLEEEAEAQGCTIIGRVKGKDYRIYRLSCSHKQEIHTGNMRVGNFRCHSCEDSFYTLPSNAYLLHIKVAADEWLKLGYAKNVDFRAAQYGLPNDAVVSVVATKPFETGKAAQEFEQSLHKRYKRKRLSVRQMAEFHIKGGQTECYPVKMVETLLAHFREPE